MMQAGPDESGALLLAVAVSGGEMQATLGLRLVSLCSRHIQQRDGEEV